MWYKREEAQRRFTFFFSSVTLAGAFGSLLASGIENLNGHGGLHGWRWIFILEGLLTMVLAFASYFLILDLPKDAKWLSEDEKAFMQERLLSEQEETTSTSNRAGLLGYITDIKSYLGAIMYFGKYQFSSLPFGMTLD